MLKKFLFVKYFLITFILFLFLSSCIKEETNYKLLNDRFDYSNEKKFKISLVKHLKKNSNIKSLDILNEFQFLYNDILKIKFNDAEKFIENKPEYFMQIINNINMSNIKEKEKLIFMITQSFLRTLNNLERVN